jgi:hypothetical protein
MLRVICFFYRLSGRKRGLGAKSVEKCGIRSGRKRRFETGLDLFVLGNDATAAMRAFPVAPLEVSARVSDLFTTVLARYGDLFVFRHTAGITESCLECILGSTEGEKQCARARLSVNGYWLSGRKR